MLAVYCREGSKFLTDRNGQEFGLCYVSRGQPYNTVNSDSVSLRLAAKTYTSRGSFQGSIGIASMHVP
jgi:hypothetical protein